MKPCILEGSLLLEEIIERTWLLDQGDWWFLTSTFLILRRYDLLVFPSIEAAGGHSLEIVECCWDHSDDTCDWIQVSPLYKLSRFWRAGAESYSSWGAQEKPHVRSLLTEPAAFPSGESASSFVFPLPSECEDQVQISPGKVLKLQTDTW